jgi:hypothetical protein
VRSPGGGCKTTPTSAGNETERDNSMKDKNDKRDKNDKQEAKFGVLDVALYIHNFRGESISVREWQFVQYA